ncbi:MAG: hypothetical protein ACXV5B_02120 [Halobacteriota archaeon]
MNPIAKMMKRCIKMPLKKALSLVFISTLLLISIAGCTSPSNNSATPSPTAAVATSAAQLNSTTTASFDPLLAQMVPTLKAQYGNNSVTQRATNINAYTVFVTFESNGRVTTAYIRNEGSIDAASRTYTSLSTCASSDIKDTASITHFGQQAATVALGHAPTTVNDTYCKGTGDNAGVDNEYIQYDQIFIQAAITAKS